MHLPTVAADVGGQRVHLDPQFLHDPPVDFDVSGTDEILASTARADTGVRKNLVQSLHRDSRRQKPAGF
jgi:hypothetical protein